LGIGVDPNGGSRAGKKILSPDLELENETLVSNFDWMTEAMSNRSWNIFGFQHQTALSLSALRVKERFCLPATWIAGICGRLPLRFERGIRKVLKIEKLAVG
jgi:hypothetical protein